MKFIHNSRIAWIERIFIGFGIEEPNVIWNRRVVPTILEPDKIFDLLEFRILRCVILIISF